MPTTRHVLRFQGCGGTLTIEADGTTYHIILENGTPPSRQEPQAPQGSEAGSRAAENREPDFYREISQEMYQQLGHLVKTISLSVRSLGLDDRSNLVLPMTSTESQGAREDSEPEVKMIEEETFSTMDLIEIIREDCGAARKQMQALEDLLDTAQPPAHEDWERLAASMAEAQSQLTRRLDEKRALLEELEEASADGADIAPAADSTGQFSLRDLFKALYDFCTNEEYKRKIKIMGEKHEEFFDTDTLLEGLRKGADALPAEDELYPLPVSFSVSFLLGQLEDTCAVPNVKNFVTKLLADAEGVFMEPAISLEKLPTTDGAAHRSGVGPSSPEAVSLVSVLRGDVAFMEALVTQWERPGAGDEAKAEARSGDTASLHQGLAQAQEAVEKIENSLTGIVGVLSSEDPSGQRLVKVAQILKGVQLDLLRTILTCNGMTKSLEAQPEVPPTKQKQLVQEEVDRVLSGLRVPEEGAAAGGNGRLNQDKVDKLLKSLGF